MMTAKEFLEKIKNVISPEWPITEYFKPWYETTTTYRVYVPGNIYREDSVNVSIEVADEIMEIMDVFNAKMTKIAEELGLDTDDVEDSYPLKLEESFNLVSVKDESFLDIPVTEFLKKLNLSVEYLKGCPNVWKILKPHLNLKKIEKTIKVTEYSL